MKHRIGFIGYGNMGGGYHWEVAHDRTDVCDDLKPVAVFDFRESQRKLAEERGMKAYDNFDDFIKHEDMDIVVVACGNNFHCEMTCRALEAGKIVIFGCGLGTPYFSTDTAAVLRAAEIEADCILMAKNIDAIYSADPKKDPNAVRYSEVTYRQILDENLRALDMTSAIFCMDNNINGYAFGLADPENIWRVVMGEAVGTAIHN
jgi:uridylate kinase